MVPPESNISLTVSDFVALLNQTFDYNFLNLEIIGELANLKVSKGQWLYFDLKDDSAILKFFGTIYNLPGPLEEGMLLKVKGTPRLHPKYGFSIHVTSIRPAGIGTIRRAADLLRMQLEKEGLFKSDRKRVLPYPPESIGLIASRQSAAYADFIKILLTRWQDIVIYSLDVLVQGENAPNQINQAIEQFNAQANPPEVLVLIRGGGSVEDLAAFNTELVTRAVAASRITTLVAIGHETDISLAELAADLKASTPSNAAELLVPEQKQILKLLMKQKQLLNNLGEDNIKDFKDQLLQTKKELYSLCCERINIHAQKVVDRRGFLNAFDPTAVLRRGYAVVRYNNAVVRQVNQLPKKGSISIELATDSFQAFLENSKKLGI